MRVTSVIKEQVYLFETPTYYLYNLIQPLEPLAKPQVDTFSGKSFGAPKFLPFR